MKVARFAETCSRGAMLAVMLPALACIGLAIPSVAAAAVPQSAAATINDTLVVKSDGSLWSWGGNLFGELGVGTTIPSTIPQRVGSDSDWARVVSGQSIGVWALKQNGSLWKWGRGITAPLAATGGAWAGPWKTLATGYTHLLLVKPNGELWATGDNRFGQLGDGTTISRSAPVHVVGGPAQWAAVAGGYGVSIGVGTDGSLWVWGANDKGQLGLGDSAAHNSPTRLGTDTGWVAVSASPDVYGDSLYAVRADGTLWAWGNNQNGKLGVGLDAPSVATPQQVQGGGWQTVAAGTYHCAALKTDGSLWAWGYNKQGQLGLAGQDYSTIPVRVGATTGFAAVACGFSQTVAVTGADQFAACGSNYHGELGMGYALERCVPEQVGSLAGWAVVDTSCQHAAAVRDDGTLWTWGQDLAGLPGLDVTVSAPRRIGFDTDWKTVSCGAGYFSAFTAAIKKDGSLWSWGANGAGQLGLGDTAGRVEPGRVGRDNDWAQVACSDGVGAGARATGPDYTIDDHTLALKTDGSLWTWGSNTFGQLGGGASPAKVARPVRIAGAWKAVAAGDDFSAGIHMDGTLWTWGRNQFGQLGLGDTTDRAHPTRVYTGTGLDTFVSLACAGGSQGSHMLAVRTDGTVWGWGANTNGELARGTLGGVFPSPVQIGVAGDWAAVACGSFWNDDFSLALKSDGTLWGWGGNFKGQLGNGDYVEKLVPAAAGTAAGGLRWRSVATGCSSLGIAQDGTLWGWGLNDDGQLGLGDAATQPVTGVFALTIFADTAPPTVTGSTGARAAAGRGSRWSKTPRTIKVSAVDDASGVSRTQISLTGGVGYLTTGSVTVSNGDVSVFCRAIDRSGNRSQPQFLGRFRIDSKRPVLSAAKSATVRHGKRATLRFRINDYSPCTVKIAVKDRRRRTVMVLRARNVRPQTQATKSFRCTLPKGSYSLWLSATDSAGNHQKRVVSAKLIVK